MVARFVADVTHPENVSSFTHFVIAAELTGPAFAVIRPNAISLASDAPPGSSERNVWSGTVGDIDRLGDRVRVGIDGVLPLTAEITLAALDVLQLRPGDQIHASVKATDIDAYPA